MRASYYEDSCVVNSFIGFGGYDGAMSKKVVSFRLSDSDILKLDEACRKFGKNRSEVIVSGIQVLLGGRIDEDGTLLKPDDGQPLTKRAPWFKTSIPERKRARD